MTPLQTAYIIVAIALLAVAIVVYPTLKDQSKKNK